MKTVAYNFFDKTYLSENTNNTGCLASQPPLPSPPGEPVLVCYWQGKARPQAKLGRVACRGFPLVNYKLIIFNK